MIPVLSTPALCTLRELQDGTYDLADVALMIDALQVRADNDSIVAELTARDSRGR